MMPSRAENVVPSAEELIGIAERASADADGLPPQLLDGYLETLVDISQHPRPLRADELSRWRGIGAQAAEQGVSMLALIDRYLSATWIVWPFLRTLTEGYEEGQRWVTGQEESLRRGFVDDLLAGWDIGGLAERAERHGLNLAGTQAVAAATSAEAFVDGGPTAQQIEAALHLRFGSRNVLVSTKDGLLVCVAPGHLTEVPDEFAGQLGAVTEPGVPWRVGIGEPHAGPGGAVRSFEQARNALEIVERLDLPDRVLRARELLVYQVLARGGVRTVTYRRQRVKELTGYSVDNPAEAFTLQAALLGVRLIGWPDSDDVQ
jgi:hypothetical protein